MRRSRFRWLALLGLLVACGEQIALSPRSDADAGSDAGSVDGGSVDAPAEVDAQQPDAQQPEKGCPRGAAAGGAGPAMVQRGGYCIDATEVTVAQYGVFLAARVPRQVDDRCKGNLSFDGCGSAVSKEEPVACVDWCDAEAYCRWAGKRLCGAVGDGGALGLSAAPAQSEWMQACSADGEPDASGCQIASSVRPVAAAEGCQRDGIYDLIGNVAEWENACGVKDGTVDFLLCQTRGGGFSDATVCGREGSKSYDTRVSDVGIRCCADVRR